MPEPVDWGAPHVDITRMQQLYAAKRAEDFLIEHPDDDDFDGLARDDLLILIRTTRGYGQGSTTQEGGHHAGPGAR